MIPNYTPFFSTEQDGEKDWEDQPAAGPPKLLCCYALRWPGRRSVLLPGELDRGLGGSQPGDGHPVGGTGHIVQPSLLEELDGRGVAAVFAAYAHMDVGAGLMAQADGVFHQAAGALDVEFLERIRLVDLSVQISGQEFAGVVPAEAVAHLSQVVGAEGEELGLLGDLVSSQSGTGNLDHGADLVGHVGASSLDDLVRSLNHHVLNILELLDLANQGDHDLGNHVPLGVLGLNVQSGLDDSLGLHHGDLRIGNSQTAATVTHHGVKLVQAGDDGLDVGHGLVHILSQLLNVGLLGGDELVQGGIQETDGDGVALHGLIHGLEVTLLHGLQLLQSLLTLLHGVGADHLTDGGDTVGLEEHVLGTAQADALSTKLHGLLGVAGVIRVGADLHLTVLVRPSHDAAELAADGSVHGGDSLAVDVTSGAVQAQPVALVIHAAGQLKLLVGLVHLDSAAAGDTAGAHAAGHDGGVRGHAAADGQDTLRGNHALDVLGRGLQTDQNHLLTASSPILGVVSGEDDLTAGSAGRSGQSGAHGGGGLQSGGIELGVEQGVQVTGIDHGNSLLLSDLTLVHQVAGNLQSGGSGTLAVTGLEHVQLAVLHGKLHVLHVVVVILQTLADFLELLEGLGELVSHLLDGHGGTHAGHHVLALGVGQELAHELLLAGGGVTGKGYAGAAVVAHVAEGHGLHVDGGAPGAGNVVHAAVNNGAGVVPGTEHGLDSAHELLLRISWEVRTDLRLVLSLELVSQLLKILSVQLNVLLNALLSLHLVDKLFKILLTNFHNYVRIHLNESSVAVPSPSWVIRLSSDSLNNFFVKTEVKDCIHHTRH